MRPGTYQFKLFDRGDYYDGIKAIGARQRAHIEGRRLLDTHMLRSRMWSSGPGPLTIDCDALRL